MYTDCRLWYTTLFAAHKNPATLNSDIYMCDNALLLDRTCIIVKYIQTWSKHVEQCYSWAQQNDHV